MAVDVRIECTDIRAEIREDLWGGEAGSPRPTVDGDGEVGWCSPHGSGVVADGRTVLGDDRGLVAVAPRVPPGRVDSVIDALFDAGLGLAFVLAAVDE